ncbi:MAG TPA: acetylxylan esterase [Terriglobia bacterium]|nr:acetylxylan esterase [Terriglobia bacterium]
MAGVRVHAQAVVIDGGADDSFWHTVRPAKLVPEGAGVPAEMGGEVRAAVAGRYLYLSAVLPEPGGNVTARSIGVNPVWEGGGEARHMKEARRITYGEPEGEDFVRFILRVYNENDWMVQVGPLGAYSIRWRWTGEHEWYTSDPKKCSGFMIASKIGKGGWSVEAAIPLAELGSPRPGYIQLAVERNRAERPGTPEEWWSWPGDQPTAGVTSLPTGSENLPDPSFRPPLLGNNQPPVLVGYRRNLPDLHESWTGAGWRNVPVWALLRNEPAERVPEFPTEVKLVQDGHTLAVLARCIEPYHVIARANERDGGVLGDDNFQVYLATSGSYYAQYAINPRGTLLDASGHQGSPRLSSPHTEWNSSVRGSAWKEPDAWFARLDIPLDQVSAVLGEIQIPTVWRILLWRHRPGRDEEAGEASVLPVTESATPFCPARYRRLKLVSQDPSQLPGPEARQRTGDLSFLPSRVFSSAQRKQMDLSSMFDSYLHNRILEMLDKDRDEWNQVRSRSDWELFRDRRLQALKAALGRFPDKCPLDIRLISEFHGKGYQRQNIVFQSQPGVWVAANLYLPDKSRRDMPGIVILHSLHAPKTQFELQDMGIIWARAGCAVLVMDQVGYGERITTYPWDRSNYNSRYVEGEQLYLIGSSLITWMVWDTERAIDLLYARPDINKKAIIVLGAVAGGGDPAAVTAALDQRVAAVVPFNFGESTPEVPRFIPTRNQWPLDLADPGLMDWDTTRVIRRGIADQFMQWFICASVAPRKFVYSYELGWHVEDLPAWARYRKVYSFYDALDNLADAHGFGPFPGPGEAWNIGPAQRRSLYPTLEHWFGIPSPFENDKSSPLENLAPRPDVERQPVTDLTVLTPEVSSRLHRRTPHEIAAEVGKKEVAAARAEFSNMTQQARLKSLQARWAKKLGNIEPTPHPKATVEWSKEMPNSRVEAISLEVEPGLVVPMLLLMPRPRQAARVPAVVAVSEGGKELFLAKRATEIEALLNAGTAVCLADVRATGEATPDGRRDPDGDENTQANTVLMMGETMLGMRLRDLRTVLVYLRSLQDIDSGRFGLWGDSFYPANPEHLLLNESPQWQIGPEIEQHVEPLGGLLAILGGLYEDDVRTIAIQGGLVSFSSMLENNFGYVPQDVVVPGILEAGDIPDVEAALAPRPLLLALMVDGLDRLVPQSDLERELEPVSNSYRNAPSGALSIRAGANQPDIANWFLKHWH